MFSGAGGLDLGLIQAGHRVVWAVDNDRDAVDTYRRNIGDRIVCAEIEAVDVHEVPDADVIVGGFPCQGFSQANMARSPDDERNSLYRYFLQFIRSKQPRYFIAENVKGILSLGHGAVIRQIAADFSDLGYSVAYRLMNMADYGVPQSRMRVIIAGTRIDLDASARFEFPPPTHSRNALHDLRPWVTVRQAIGDLPDPGTCIADDPDQVCSAYKVEYRDFTGHRRTDPDKPCPTILARGNGKGGVCAIPHFNGRRRLTIRESATIQTFPADFSFSGCMNSRYRQVGNAVPVAFARLLGEELKRLESGDIRT